MSLPRPINWLNQPDTEVIVEESGEGVGDGVGRVSQFPVLKIYGEDGRIIVGYGMNAYIAEEVNEIIAEHEEYYESDDYPYREPPIITPDDLINATLDELVSRWNAVMEELNRMGRGPAVPYESVTIEYHEIDSWVGWQIPDFWPGDSQ